MKRQVKYHERSPAASVTAEATAVEESRLAGPTNDPNATDRPSATH